MNNNFTKKQFGVEKELNMNVKGEVDNLPDNIDVTFSEPSDEDSVESEVVKNVVENVLKTDSDSTISNEDDDCFLNNYLPKSKVKNNLKDEPTLVMYQVCGSDKLYPDEEFPIENVNVDKLEKVFKLVEIDVSEVDRLSSSKRFLNFQKDKSYYNKPRNPPRFQNNNQNKGVYGQRDGKNNQRRNFQKSKFVNKTTLVKSSSSMNDQESEIFSKTNEEFFEKKASQTQTEGPSRVIDNRTCSKCNKVGHIARKCTNSKRKSVVVENTKKPNDVKGKAPMFVEKKIQKPEKC
ncbi:uncharacterized protein LOC110913430 [Helianthus annuus]|uniref:uncharacterized protein LOC110913430 n=1 Tax=Helianthus annuus TaxID=4232 RepID=UPI000B8FABBC|nr:uncharacterized protein LOC110913430 [Helianthus annuus]